MKTLYLVTISSGKVKDIYAKSPLEAAKLARQMFLTSTKSVVRG